MSDITKSITITLPSNHDGDILIEAILFLRIFSRTYPQVFDIAINALQSDITRLSMQEHVSWVASNE